MVVHAGEELSFDGKTRGRPNHSVDCAFRTESCSILINPLGYGGRGKYLGTIKAAADFARLDFGTMQTAMLVGLDVRWIESVRVKPKHRNRSIYRIRRSNTATPAGEGALLNAPAHSTDSSKFRCRSLAR